MEFEKMQEIITSVLNIPESDIKPETTFVGDLGADSLDIIQIVMGIEEEYDIKIEDEDIKKISCVQDAVDQIREAKA
ncbi:MAG: acyl carrier protein [Hespellia sp.]|nr:acyl carrier protein [Hespellia sp.]